ncbi:MAG: MFS transporter [Actinomycetota bacterium]
MRKWAALAVLALAQFLMVLDQAVMNVSISQLVEDFDTNVTTIQAVITLYALVMAMLMLTGGKLGDLLGRRRAFTIGLIIYGSGSALTAASWNVGTLVLGWSVLEGVGAALVLPALVALIAANYEGRDRVAAFGVIGGVSGVGIAVGPIVGGFFTANLSWRWVFVGEVIVAAAIVLVVRAVADSRPADRRPQLDVVGAALSAAGLGTIVIALLQSSSWGWIEPRRSPITPFGFALTPFVVLAGVGILVVFVRWQEHRIAVGRDPLVRLGLFASRTLRAGLSCFFCQNLILLGIFFIVPLYLQIVLGLDALETGVRMLPISVTMFVTSTLGPALAGRVGPRLVVRAGFVLLAVAAFAMLETIEPELTGIAFGASLGLLGVGMGLVASQLGNVIQSSVEADDRSEAGGLQNTAQQVGSAAGTALVGAVVLSALLGAFTSSISDNDRVSAELSDAIEVQVAAGGSFVAAAEVEAALSGSGVDGDEADAVIEDYEQAQLAALREGLLLSGALALVALGLTRRLPTSIGGS